VSTFCIRRCLKWGIFKKTVFLELMVTAWSPFGHKCKNCSKFEQFGEVFDADKSRSALAQTRGSFPLIPPKKAGISILSSPTIDS